MLLSRDAYPGRQHKQCVRRSRNFLRKNIGKSASSGDGNAHGHGWVALLSCCLSSSIFARRPCSSKVNKYREEGEALCKGRCLLFGPGALWGMILPSEDSLCLARSYKEMGFTGGERKTSQDGVGHCKHGEQRYQSIEVASSAQAPQSCTCRSQLVCQRQGSYSM